MVLGAGGDEQQVAGCEWSAFVPVDEHALAADHCVELILFVRGLLVRRPRDRKPNIERAAVEHWHRPLAFGRGDAGFRIGEADHAATGIGVHGDLRAYRTVLPRRHPGESRGPGPQAVRSDTPRP